MAKKVIKYLRGPAFTEAEWAARNPLLLKGEVGYVISSGGIITRSKVGPGLWNDLPWFPDTLYDRTDTITNPIGDAKGNLNGSTLMEIVEKMLFPYQTPALSLVKNNAGGSLQTTATREIGSSLSGIVNLTYAISNPTNLSGATPINVTAGGIFSNEGNFENLGSIDLNLVAPLNPTVVTTYTISVKPVHQQGEGTTVSTSIVYYPRIIWGVSPLTSLSASQLNTIGQKQTLLTNNFRRDYNFTAAGYCWIAIPTILNPSALVFTDVTDPNAPAGFSMEDMGTLSVNNGVGTYNYQLFRSTYYLTESLSKMRIA